MSYKFQSVTRNGVLIVKRKPEGCVVAVVGNGEIRVEKSILRQDEEKALAEYIQDLITKDRVQKAYSAGEETDVINSLKKRLKNAKAKQSKSV